MNFLDGFYFWLGSIGASVVVWALVVLAVIIVWAALEFETNRRRRRDRNLLRRHVVRYYLHRDEAGCLLCGGVWKMGEKEAHRPFCAAE